eukprot:666177-Pleurochrysis_carterae.AAC.1
MWRPCERWRAPSSASRAHGAPPHLRQLLALADKQRAPSRPRTPCATSRPPSDNGDTTTLRRARNSSHVVEHGQPPRVRCSSSCPCHSYGRHVELLQRLSSPRATRRHLAQRGLHRFLGRLAATGTHSPSSSKVEADHGAAMVHKDEGALIVGGVGV